MTEHPYAQHVDVRDLDGEYFGPLMVALERSELVLQTLDHPLAPILFGHGAAPTAITVTTIRIRLTIYTVCRRMPGSILLSERACVLVNPREHAAIIDANLMRHYHRDPLGADEREWVDDFITQTRRKS